MHRQEFINILKEKLSGIPQTDLEKTLDYYSEIISEKLDEGMNEEEAINSLGTIDEIVKNILSEIPLKKLVKEKFNLNRKLKTWEIILLSSTAIIWVPILISLTAIVIAVYISLWSGVIALGASAISCAATSLIMFLGIIDIFTANFGSGLVLIGVGMAALGLAILLGLLTFELSKVMIKVCKKFVLKIKSLFIRGEK